jgi:transposase InsO family protein
MSNRVKISRALLKQIVTIHETSHETYGSPRVFETLKNQGVPCSENRVARLMRQAGLQGRVVKVTRRAPGVQQFFERHENLRIGNPVPPTINQQWVGDLTFLRVQGQPCFLSVVMDVCSRKIIGWALGRNRSTQLTTRAFVRAIKDRNPDPGCIFHSDRGSEYGCYDYANMLKRYGFRVSMNRAYHSQDNAHMESFFHSMKAEWIRGRSFESLEHLESALKTYMRFYNRYRLHSGIDYHTPIEYEKIITQ